MRKTCGSILLLCLGVQFCSASVRIIENSVRRLTFEWTTDDVKIIQNQGAPALFSFSGANVDLGEYSEPLVPAYSFYVGVPTQGEAVMSFSANASHSMVLSQQPKVLAAPKTGKKTGKRFPNLAFPHPWISSGRACLLSDLNCRQFFLRPFVYDPATKVRADT